MSRRTPTAPFTSLHILLLLLAIAAMMVDVPSRWTSGRGILGHAEWDGALPADLVSPVFLFFMGAAIPLSPRRIRTATLLGIAAAFCAIGLALNGLWRADLATWRVTGVLPRAGVTLAVAAAADAATTGDHRRRIALLASVAALITLTYWLVMAHVPPPGGTAGDLAPAVNLAAWVDRVALGPHAWNGSWDPDGILSTVSSIATVLAGFVAGIAITSNTRRARATLQLIGAGAGAAVGGIVWTPMVPLNRSLWSASFVVFSAGVAAILLAAWCWRGTEIAEQRQQRSQTKSPRRPRRGLARRGRSSDLRSADTALRAAEGREIYGYKQPINRVLLVSVDLSPFCRPAGGRRRRNDRCSGPLRGLRDL